MSDPTLDPQTNAGATVVFSKTIAETKLQTDAEVPISTQLVAAPKDAVNVPIPEEDEDEEDFHKFTLILQENERERVTIPADFVSQFLWMPPRHDKESSSKFVAPKSQVVIPPGLLADTHVALTTSLSEKAQLASLPSKPVRPIATSQENTRPARPPSPIPRAPSPDPDEIVEPVITLYVPFDNTANVIDAIVAGVCVTQGADVVVIDAATLAQGEAGTLGPDLSPFLKKLYGISGDSDPAHRTRQIRRYLRALIDVKPQADDTTKSNNDTPDRPRIIYVKDFGGIASMSKPLLTELILAIRSRRLALQPDEDYAPNPSLLQRTTLVLGVSHSPENAPHACCPSCTWTNFMSGFETSDAAKLCMLLPDILQPTITKGTGDDDIAKTIADALFTVPKRVAYAERAYTDPDVGTSSIYREIISAYGFSDSRDPYKKRRASVSEGGGVGNSRPDDALWRAGKATTQRERREALGEMRLARNEYSIRKALGALGAKIPENINIFSGLADEEIEEEADESEKKKGKKKASGETSAKKRKSRRQLELEKYSTKAGIRDNLLSRSAADRIAAIALHGLPESTSTTSTQDLILRNGSSDAAVGAANTLGSPRSPPDSVLVTPESLATAIKASLVGSDERKRWLATQEKLKTAAERLESGNDESDKEGSDEDGLAKEDKVVSRVRASGVLNPYEERLLGGVIDTTQLKTSFDDVCIDPKIVENVRMIISLPLMYPKAFSTGILGSEAMAGILLYGPPGTGKTMLCRAVAKECNVRMLLVSPSSVQDKWVGETEKLVKAIFTLARKIAPCVIFIDEVDALFGARSSDSSNGAQYHRSMLTEFMQEMDGLKTAGENKKKGVVVIGATNRPFDLGDAVLRRLPRRMLLDLPGPKEREQILQVHLRGEVMEGIDLSDLARRTANFSGSDLKNLAVAAALASLKDVLPEMWQAKAKLDAAKARKVAEDTDSSDESTEDEKPDKKGPKDSKPEEKPTKDDDDSDDDSDDDETPDLAPRILRVSHFKTAFEQVSATCSRDMASVQRLRTWAAQFSRDIGAGLSTAASATNTIPAAAPPNGNALPVNGATTPGGYRPPAQGEGLWDHRNGRGSRFSSTGRPGGSNGGG